MGYKLTNHSEREPSRGFQIQKQGGCNGPPRPKGCENGWERTAKRSRKTIEDLPGALIHG